MLSLLALAVAAAISPIGQAHAQPTKAQILSTRVICSEPGRYVGWPTIAKTTGGELLTVFSGDRDAHVCPWGKTELVRSADNGVTWSAPVVVNNTPLDDRDAGIIVTRRGTLIVSWFTSLAFAEPSYLKHYPPEITASWKRHTEKLSPDIRKQWLGCWVRRSVDNGASWGDCIRVPVNAPHGPVECADGRLIYVGKTLWDEPQKLQAAESRDDGRTWKVIGGISVAPGENISHYHELHAVELENGDIVALIRYNPPEKDNNIMRQTVSRDGGKTWSTPRPTGIWGYPPHLIRLRDNRVVVVYGHRREPFGERACVSYDGCRTWDTDHPIDLYPCVNTDLGYPASVEMEDGSIYTVYYQVERKGEQTVLMGTHWRLE